MLSDIVIPNNNEAEFIEISSKLNIKKIYFLYDFDEYNEENTQKKLSSIKNHKNVNIEIGLMVNQKNINKAVQQSRFLVARSSDKDRIFIEGKKIRLVYGFEEISRKDYLHQRASGLNHIICELAKKNNVAVGFSYSLLSNKDENSKSIMIGRIIQNINLCRKYNVKTVIGSFSENPFDLRSVHDIMSLFAILGMDGGMIKDSTSFDL